ncbi:MAG: cell division protein FtsQ/DivIB [Balneolaceae bacterium]|nr:cell division protein FtsQ/DivIB [Balneolaceae bacterium]
MTDRNKHTTGTGKSITWIGAVLFLLGLAVLAGFYWNRTVTIREVQYAGNRFVSQEELSSQVTVPTGVSPDSVDFMTIINRLEEMPYVKQAAVEVEPSGNLTIQITEREPVALLADGERKVYVDRDGLRMPLRLGKPVDVPILYGFKTEPLSDTLKSEAWTQVRDFLTEIQKQPFTNSTISEIAWTPGEGIVALVYDNGVKLVFGRDDFATKLRNWKAFYAEVIREKGIEKMKTVDLRFEGQIVTREG